MPVAVILLALAALASLSLFVGAIDMSPGDLWRDPEALRLMLVSRLPRTLAAMLAKILGGLSTSSDSPLWWSVVFGANLGGNLTPIGSASTLVAVTIMHKHRLDMSFARFVRTASPYAVAQLMLATLYVLVFLR